MLESQTFLGKDSTFSDEKLQRKEEYISQNEIFGINRLVLVLSLCAAFNSVIIGFNLGVFGGVVFVLQGYMDLNSFQSGLLMGMLNFVAIFGSIVAGYTSDKYGRLKTFTLASILFFIGGLVLIVSSNFFVLMIGRTIVGLGTGIGFSVDPLYIAEISPKEVRGALVTLSEIAINVGIVLGYFSTWLFSSVNSSISWRLMLSVGVVLPLIMLFLSLFKMDETPRYLLMQGNHRKAMSVLLKLSKDNETAVRIFEDIKLALEKEADYDQVPIKHLITGKDLAKPLKRIMMVVIVVATVQQFSGVDGVMGFISFTLKKAGMTKNEDLFGHQLFIGILKTLMILVSARLLDDKVGRRILLLISSVGSAAAHASIAIGSMFEVLWLETLGLYAFAMFFSVGLGPVSWLIISEIVPLRVRSNGIMIGVSLNRFAGFLVA
jgi:sugar porter (SP) family MFS transporter